MSSDATKFSKGDIVEIIEEFQDDGDSEYTWIVMSNEEKGRVEISAIDSLLKIKPVHVVKVEWIKHKIINIH